jgi:hypothetical protein
MVLAHACMMHVLLLPSEAALLESLGVFSSGAEILLIGEESEM